MVRSPPQRAPLAPTVMVTISEQCTTVGGTGSSPRRHGPPHTTLGNRKETKEETMATSHCHCVHSLKSLPGHRPTLRKAAGGTLHDEQDKDIWDKGKRSQVKVGEENNLYISLKPKAVDLNTW